MTELRAVNREALPGTEFGLAQVAPIRDARKESGNFPVRDDAVAPGFTRYGAK